MPKKRKTDKSTIISFIHTFSPVSFYFILLASPKKKQTNKQTNKQKELWQGHRNSCGQLQRARMFYLTTKRPWARLSPLLQGLTGLVLIRADLFASDTSHKCMAVKAWGKRERGFSSLARRDTERHWSISYITGNASKVWKFQKHKYI